MAEHIAEDQNHIQKGKILSRQKRSIIGSCAAVGPCVEGQGDCDIDSDCLGELTCTVPGGVQTGMDLCFCPTGPRTCNIGKYLKGTFRFQFLLNPLYNKNSLPMLFLSQLN